MWIHVHNNLPRGTKKKGMKCSHSSVELNTNGIPKAICNDCGEELSAEQVKHLMEFIFD